MIKRNFSSNREARRANGNSIFLLVVLVLAVFHFGHSSSFALQTPKKHELKQNFSQSMLNKEITSRKQRKISLKLDEVPLLSALQKLAKKARVGISYQHDAIPDKKVTLYLNDISIFQALELILKDTELQAVLPYSRDVIVIKKKKLEAKIQQETITGTVSDASSGKTLPGVNIRVKGTTTGTSTDADGNYSLAVESLQDTLVFSFVGYQTRTVPISGRTSIDIALKTQTLLGQEMVVVGYGTQKKENLTGSVSTVDQESIQDVPVTQTSQALAGQTSGVSIRQASGAPGKGHAKIRIRGSGTFSSAGNDPLVIIDGMPSSLDNVVPNDIASISVLKDAASAAIYGSRAANGVILVETKKGKQGEIEVSYNGYVGVQNETETPNFVDSWNYAKAKNEALSNAGQGKVYSQEDIQKYKAGSDPQYPNTKHYKRFFESGNGLQTHHNLQFQGGNENSRYFVSTGYLRKNGLVTENYNDRYSLRFNFDSDISDHFNLKLNMAGNISKEHEPGAFTGNGTLERLVTRVTRQNATQFIKSPEGYYSHIDRGAPWAALDSKNFAQNRGSHLLSNLALTYNILQSLELSIGGGYELNDSKYKIFRSKFQVDPTLVEKPSRLSQNVNGDHTVTLNGTVKYSKTFKKHEIHVVGGYSQIDSRSENTHAYRDNFPNNNLYELAAASSANMQANGSASEWALRSYFGRVRYAYKNKYLFEMNGRYDGSSRFRKGNRYGFFPSFSAGWRIANESFIKNHFSWINNLKLRASWGELGNQQVGVYPYQSTINTDQNYVFGSGIVPGVAVNQLANKDISWETTRMTDVGMDVSFFDSKLSLTTDYFHKKTEDILYPLSVTGVLGMQGSVQNAGQVLNKGWEFSLSYKNSAGNFSYSISPNFSLVHTEVQKLANNIKRDIGQNLFIGQPLNAIYGYVADGLYVDEQDIQNYPEQSYTPQPGDIRYKDISGPNGVPDGKVDATYDRKVIGQISPQYTYGAQLTANYRNFDFSLQLQGAAGMKRALEHYAARAFANGSNVQQWMWDNRWTSENPDRNAIYPRFLIHGEGRSEPYSYTSTYWFRDASYLRIKFAQIGYNLPSKLTNSLHLNSLRLYVSGRNLYTFDDYYPGWDPEMSVEAAQGGQYYPLSRIYNVGINIKF